MSKTFILILVAMLTSAPVGLAHLPAGTPKNYCEHPSEWNVHDYSGPPDGKTLVGYYDGNRVGDCDGQMDVQPGRPCGAIQLGDPLASDPGICGTDVNPPLGDWDGHAEFAIGGAWLLVDSGDGESYGTLHCWGAEGHHPTFGPIYVTLAVEFYVMADTVDVTALGQGCGDFEDDVSTHCVYSCSVTFPPGLDGAYHVKVNDFHPGDHVIS